MASNNSNVDALAHAKMIGQPSGVHRIAGGTLGWVMRHQAATLALVAGLAAPHAIANAAQAPGGLQLADGTVEHVEQSVPSKPAPGKFLTWEVDEPAPVIVNLDAKGRGHLVLLDPDGRQIEPEQPVVVYFNVYGKDYFSRIDPKDEEARRRPEKIYGGPIMILSAVKRQSGEYTFKFHSIDGVPDPINSGKEVLTRSGAPLQVPAVENEYGAQGQTVLLEQGEGQGLDGSASAHIGETHDALDDRRASHQEYENG